MRYRNWRPSRERARVLIIVAAALLAGLPAAAKADGNNEFKIISLSSRPDIVSGGTVLVRIELPRDVVSNDLVITLNSQAVTSAFRPEQSGPSLLGLLTGLALGKNALMAKAIGPNNTPYRSAQLNLTNYPITGPIFSGPHEEPFYCMTQLFELPASTQTLEPALDTDCSIATRVDYVYRTTGSVFKPLPSLTSFPTDLAQTMTSEGKTVPYIVRVETGTINRAIYQTAILHDPTTELAPTPFSPPSAWNRRLVYTFGGGCPGGWYIQGTSIGNSGILEDLLLRQGYGVASSTLNVFGNNCNDVLAAETLSMVREQFIKNFGPVVFTMGWGCSAGAEGQNTAADAYPGLLDGIVTACNFTDPTSTLMLPNTDARLFSQYLSNTSVSWSGEQTLAAAGVSTLMALSNMGSGIGVYTVAQGGDCNAAIPASTIFDQNTNPHGVRCDFFDHNRNVFGVDPSTGYARRTFDNVGVQYGLTALNARQITTQQFIDLNQNIGGFDNNGNFVPTRAIGDLGAIKIAYQSDRVVYTGLGMRRTPIIDYRAYEDLAPSSIDQHQREQSFMTRARLLATNGDFDNEVMLVESNYYGNFSDTSPGCLARAHADG